MPRILVNGYGTVGKRVADAVAQQDDMSLAGVVHTEPDHLAALALRNGYALHATDAERAEAFQAQGLPIEGTLEDALEGADLVVDCTPSGVGARNLPRYEQAGLPAIFQGGEDHELTGCSFNATHAFEPAIGREAVRVVSCNTTGLARSLGTLWRTFDGLEDPTAVLVRRAADPHETGKGPIDGVVPEMQIPSHHGPDLATVCEGLELRSIALKVPTTHMHVHAVTCSAPEELTPTDVVERLQADPRVLVVPGGQRMGSTNELIAFARDTGRARHDLWELVVWGESIHVERGHLSWIQAVHQEAIVVPENIDAIRAMLELADRETSMERTDAALGVGSFGPGPVRRPEQSPWDPPTVA